MSVYKKNYAAYIVASSDEHGSIDKAIAALQNVFNLTRWDAISYLFKLGVENAMQHVESEADRQEIKAAMTRSKLIEVIRARSKDDSEIRRGMAELGYDSIVSAAREDGLPEDEVRAILDRVKAEMPYTSTVGQWLDTYLADGKPRRTTDIKNDAIREGYLPDEGDPSFETKWGTMKAVASRLGFSGGSYGEWQKKLL